MINWYDQKFLGAEPWATFISMGSWYKETCKKAREKQKILKKKILWSLTKLV